MALSILKKLFFFFIPPIFESISNAFLKDIIASLIIPFFIEISPCKNHNSACFELKDKACLM